MIVKKHSNIEGQIILAICDSDLLGKKIQDDKLQLDLSSNFYQGEEKTEEELKEMIKSAHLLNVVGNDSILFLRKMNLVKDTIKIKGIEHVQILINNN